jgi:hypothetical protein
MRGRFSSPSGRAFKEANIYANKSAVVLDWLLRVGIEKESFSLREITRERPISLGLVQRVLKTLAFSGLLQIEGSRTTKRFVLAKPGLLLRSWLEQYSIIKKCSMWAYRSAFYDKEEMLPALRKAGVGEKVALALHSAAEAYGYKNTNLRTLELYVIDPNIRQNSKKYSI